MKGTIKSKERISSIFVHGNKYAGAGFLSLYEAFVDEGQGRQRAPEGRVAYIAGKKLGTAPERNRAKRRLREAARLAGAPWNGYDVVLVARQGVCDTEFTAMVRTLKRLGELLGGQQNERQESANRDYLAKGSSAVVESGNKAGANEKGKRIFSFVVGIPQNITIVCINIYRHVISPLLPPSCRYVPTCSEYALIALQRFGFCRGSWLAVKRIGRCHPLYPGGYDPVPERIDRKLA